MVSQTRLDIRYMYIVSVVRSLNIVKQRMKILTALLPQQLYRVVSVSECVCVCV